MIRILLKDEGYGLTRDAQVISHCLDECGIASRCVNVLRQGDPEDHARVNLFLEAIEPGWLSAAKTNMLVPNPEWLRPATRALLPAMDYVLCKTRCAERIFRGLGCNTHFIGFTGVRRMLGGHQRNFAECLHVGGKSPNKGTDALLNCWRQHPEWPLLRAISHQSTPSLIESSNVALERRYLPDAEVRRLQNKHGIHLCPSEVEGYGHTIVEGMSAGAVVITTDAPPMNELVQPDRGFLIPSGSAFPVMAGTRYAISPVALEQTIESVLAESPENLVRLGRSANAWFHANDRLFRRRLSSLIAALL